MKRWILLLLVSALTSCSATWHLEKAVKKDPTVLEKQDVTVIDSIVLPPVKVRDTVVLKEHDTIRLVNDKLRVQIVKVKDTITIDAVCESDTIISVVEVPVDRVVYKERVKPLDQIKTLGLYLLLGLVAWKVIESQLLKR
jgi:hypothetical protein